MSAWVVAIQAGGLTSTDTGSGDVAWKPYQITDSTRVALDRPAALAGTTLRLRMRYSESETADPESPLRVRVFGRVAEEEPWAPLCNAVGDRSVEIRWNLADDVYDGDESRYTTPDNHAHSWDCDGNRYFLVLVEVALDTAHAEDAELQAKIV